MQESGVSGREGLELNEEEKEEFHSISNHTFSQNE